MIQPRNPHGVNNSAVSCVTSVLDAYWTLLDRFQQNVPIQSVPRLNIIHIAIIDNLPTPIAGFRSYERNFPLQLVHAIIKVKTVQLIQGDDDPIFDRPPVELFARPLIQESIAILVI